MSECASSSLSACRLSPSRLLQLLEISARLNSKESREKLLPYIISTAAEVLDCDAASLLLYDEATEQLRFAAATGADPEALARIPVPLEGSIAGTIFRTKRSVRIEDAHEDRRHYATVDQQVDFHTRSLIGVPMQVEGRVVGVLEALNKREGDFSDEDEMMLCVIADQAAVAIRTARHVQALQTAHDRLARMEAMKSRFLTLASHELRTPLTTVKGFAQLIRDEAEAVTAAHAEIILEEVDTIDDLLAAMGEMNALRTGTDAFTPQLLAVADVFEYAHAATAATFTEKQHALTVEPPAKPLFVRADAVKLTTALTNLLDNAARFTAPGGRIALRARAQGGGSLIEVEDSGCGLAPAHLDAVFSDFFQVEDALTRTHGGLGLGLTIARGIVEIHGGRLWAESEGLGRGATFYLWLPAPSFNPAFAPQPAAASVVPLTPAPSTTSGAKPATRMAGRGPITGHPTSGS